MPISIRAQFQAPPWAAEELVDRFFPDLGPGDRVLEPSCGAGGMLGAIPAAAEAIGVEIDPAMAAEARRRTGRPVICGDFAEVGLPWAPTAVFGNPPFEMGLVERWLARFAREMPEGGRCGLILPAYAVQTPDRVVHWTDSWSVESHHLPRTLFPGLQAPVIFAMFRKDRLGLLRGFALYRRASAVGAMGARGRLMLARDGATWRDVVAAAGTRPSCSPPSARRSARSRTCQGGCAPATGSCRPPSRRGMISTEPVPTRP